MIHYSRYFYSFGHKNKGPDKKEKNKWLEKLLVSAEHHNHKKKEYLGTSLTDVWHRHHVVTGLGISEQKFCFCATVLAIGRLQTLDKTIFHKTESQILTEFFVSLCFHSENWEAIHSLALASKTSCLSTSGGFLFCLGQVCFGQNFLHSLEGNPHSKCVTRQMSAGGGKSWDMNSLPLCERHSRTKQIFLLPLELLTQTFVLHPSDLSVKHLRSQVQLSVHNMLIQICLIW